MVRQADALATKYGKSRRDVLFKAGFGLKSTRESNSWNIFCAWHAAHSDVPHTKGKYLLSAI